MRRLLIFSILHFSIMATGGIANAQPGSQLRFCIGADPKTLNPLLVDDDASDTVRWALFPVYVRGVAYLAAGHAREAAAEFQKILDHRGIVVSDPIGALAHLQLGRAFALSGDTIKAKAAYQDFLALWKDADPDIPIFMQAKSEYAKL